MYRIAVHKSKSDRPGEYPIQVTVSGRRDSIDCRTPRDALILANGIAHGFMVMCARSAIDWVGVEKPQ